MRQLSISDASILLFRKRSGARKGGPGTLNDTELRKNFRRKNTARKSFLGHARRLNDLPIEAAKVWPTQCFGAHRRNFVGPPVGGDRRQPNGAEPRRICSSRNIAFSSPRLIVVLTSYLTSSWFLTQSVYPNGMQPAVPPQILRRKKAKGAVVSQFEI
jgi:hypothetical protein